MNIYSRKYLWKWGLLGSGVLIVAISIFYTNWLVKKLSKEEDSKVNSWAKSIEKDANFVLYTNQLFSRLEKEERKNADLWAKATKSLTSITNMECDLGFVFEVVRSNTTVPVILTDQNKKPISSKNVDSTLNFQGYTPDNLYGKFKTSINGKDSTLLIDKKQFDETPPHIWSNEYNQSIRQHAVEQMTKYNPIEINILNKKKNYLFYQDSKLFTELKSARDSLTDKFNKSISDNFTNIPVIYIDSQSKRPIAYGNIDSSIVGDSTKLKAMLVKMAYYKHPLTVHLGNNQKGIIYFDESFLLTQLRYYPYIQFSIIGLFSLIAYFMFHTSRRAEQNQVWVGMAKETAHQLGTPLSSLIAWVEVLKMQYPTDESFEEINKDLDRLQTITDRFSKIGSKGSMTTVNIQDALLKSIEYLQKRVSSRVNFNLDYCIDYDLKIPLNLPLFEWVIENISKNAVDAMKGDGTLLFTVSEEHDKVFLDIKDTGGGLTKKQYKSIFKPGYTSKKRGWGLGLTLVKRIIEQYHQGKIYVKSSEIDKGTTFRIILNKH